MATAQQDKVCRVLPERTGGRREPLYHLFYSRMNRFLQRPGWALWGASIPVISVTVMGTEEKTNTGSIPMQEDGQMKKSYIREKKYRCGSEYMAVGVYAVTDQEHRRRGKKHKESDRGQKERNKHASLRRKQRKAIANFGRDGFFLTGTYEESYLPEDFAACRRDVENYKRRVIGATVKRFGVSRDKIRLMLWAVRKGEAGRLHMHGFAECVGMGAADRREWREMLEDLWQLSGLQSAEKQDYSQYQNDLANWTEGLQYKKNEYDNAYSAKQNGWQNFMNGALQVAGIAAKILPLFFI